MCNVCCAHSALKQEGLKDERLGVEIRAWGRAEFSPAVYQIRRIGEQWPEYWESTLDLAGTMVDFGFDVKLEDDEIEKIKKKLDRLLDRQDYYKQKERELYNYRNNDVNVLKDDEEKINAN